MGVSPQLTGIMLDQTTYYHGVFYSSMAGGTDIMFSGQGMSMYPSDMTVVYTGYDITFIGDGSPLTCTLLIYF